MTLQVACSRLASVEEFSASDCGCSCTLSEDAIGEALDNASDLVFYLSGGAIFGECEGTVRPCRTCWCGSCAGCCEIDVVPLRQDALGITEVKIDGEVVSPSLYALLPRGRLMKLSADLNRPDPWPSTQSLWRPLTALDTFGITYPYGQADQPLWVKNAVIELACDWTTHFEGGRSKLPDSTTAATYSNVTVTLQSRTEALKDQTVLAEFPAVAQLLALVGPTVRGGAWSPSGSSSWSFPLS